MIRRPAALLLLLAARAGAEEPRRIRIEADDVRIEADTVVEPGTYAVADANGNGVLQVAKDGVKLTLDGVTLVGAAPDALPDEFRGIGVAVVGCKGVEVRGGAVRGFKVGLRAERADGLRVTGLDASGNFEQRLGSTPEREDPSDWLWPHHNDAGEWERNYGAGISVTDSRDVRVAACTVRHGQNGVLLTRCSKAHVFDGDYSFNSGWGIALYRTVESDVSNNRCDWCVRGYSHGVYARGQDSAGILVFEQCSDNRFLRNSATHSGDGYFLYAGHETTRRTGTGGSNRNFVQGNDFSFAVANGIEATFSEGNIFTGNDCSGCDHGVWAGYSRRTEIDGTKALGCLTAGVSIEHGQENLIANNWIEARGDGVHLWWDEDEDLLESPYCKDRDCTSSRNVVRENRIRAGREAIRRVGDEGSTVVGNVLVGPGEAFEGPFGGRYSGMIGRGSRSTALPADMPRGREHIRVGEWGPIDPRESRVFPDRVDAAGNVARFWILGKEPVRVLRKTDGVAVAVAGDGKSLSVTNAAPDALSWLPFEVEVALGERKQVLRGSLVVARWDVRWFAWEKDPRQDAAAFETLVAGEPLARESPWGLDYAWRTGGPPGVAADRFATVATTTLRLPAGRWRVRTVSDDGVRVRIDGRVVLENWTWHGPTEDTAEVDLAEGSHAVRVDHFELDGWAHLRLSLERVHR